MEKTALYLQYLYKKTTYSEEITVLTVAFASVWGLILCDIRVSPSGSRGGFLILCMYVAAVSVGNLSVLKATFFVQLSLTDGN